MGLSFFDFLRPRSGKAGLVDEAEIRCRELMDAAMEYQIRELCWWSCVNWVGNILGRCEVKTYNQGRESKGGEWYLWNVAPNDRQNSSAFWHAFAGKLFQDNEVLLIPQKLRDGRLGLLIADDWEESDWQPGRSTEYRNVRVWDYKFSRGYREDDVMHLKLHHTSARRVVDALYSSYVRLVQAAMSAYGWQNGQHWKVHVSQVASGEKGWAAKFQQMLETQIKPFLSSGGAVLPEFDGYKYEKIDGNSGTQGTRDIKAMIDDILEFTAMGLCLPVVLIRGGVEATGDAMQRALTACIDPICDQVGEEGTRKRYGTAKALAGDYMRMDSSAVGHFDLFANAVNIEKLLGSGWSLNDIRRAAGEEPINEPWANEHLITKNIGRLDTQEA